MEFDFAGYVTKNDVICADGRTIKKNAFKNQNGMKVPLVWMHQRNEPENVLGHAILENREDGVYGYCKFNTSPRGKQAKLLVEHGDINSMSIYANQLVQKDGAVSHGVIREVSLVIAPANPGALIDNPIVRHSDDGQEYEDETQAIIHSGCDICFDDVEYDLPLEHAVPTKKKKKKEEPKPEEEVEDEEKDLDNSEEDPEDEDETDEEEEDKMKNTRSVQHADENTKPKTKKTSNDEEEDEDDGETVQDVYDTLTEKQKKVVAYMIGAALAEKEDEAKHSAMEGDDSMPRNIFDQDSYLEMSDNTPALSHDQISAIFADAQKCGSLKQACLEHAEEYGIEDIDVLFPDARAVANEPYMIQRDMEWVSEVLSETKHVPFSRIKSTTADITADEARAKGYVKGKKKTEEVVKLLKRVTIPTTIYKKQKLDRDDILDISDFNVVAWLKAEMRVMLNEEIARAILVSDGRTAMSDDKINEENIRPIWKDDDMYAHHIILADDVSTDDLPEQFLMAQKEYKGSGSPVLYTTATLRLQMLLLKDKIGRRLYNTDAELAAALGVRKIVSVPVMDDLTREADSNTNGGNAEMDDQEVKLLGIIVNLTDYFVGTNAGGEINNFDDFDIDYNQYKYLMETRMSGALVKPKSAVIIEQKVAEG